MKLTNEEKLLEALSKHTSRVRASDIGVTIPNGSLYITLARMSAKGLVSIKTYDLGHSYAITAFGLKVMRAKRALRKVMEG